MLRERCGKWHYRFQADGREFHGSTQLPATEANRPAAAQKEAAVRALVEVGHGDALSPGRISFGGALRRHLRWCYTEYKPSSARRFEISFASLRRFFGDRRKVGSITAGQIEEYKAWRRVEQRVSAATLRNDLNALSAFFEFARRCRWVSRNPVRDVERPRTEVPPQHPLKELEKRLRWALNYSGCMMRQFGFNLEPIRDDLARLCAEVRSLQPGVGAADAGREEGHGA